MSQRGALGNHAEEQEQRPTQSAAQHSTAKRTVSYVSDDLCQVVATDCEGGGVAARFQQLEQHTQQLAVVVNKLFGVVPPECACSAAGTPQTWLCE